MNAGICPTPTIIYKKNQLNIMGGVIISGSHNPPKWNALKLLSRSTFLDKSELDEFISLLNKIKLNDYRKPKKKQRKLTNINPIPDYINAVYEHLDYDSIVSSNDLNVVIDTGAGAGKLVTPKILEGLSCEVLSINENFTKKGKFPRKIEPIEENLEDLIMKVWKDKADLGFAHDADADRLAIVGDDYKCYSEDVGLALITEHYLREKYKENKENEIIFVTNVASSLIFEELAKKYNAKIIRTPIGECYLSQKMNALIKNHSKSNNMLVFGGEGSCGGVMLPSFNNARDGIFAAAKIIEILVKSGMKISELVSQLPKYHNYRENIEIKNIDIQSLIDQVERELINEGEDLVRIGNDLRFGKKNEWFVLIHPSNTEPIVRVISEAKRESLARIYGQPTAELVRMILNRI
ncbi:MAG: hypothetical protein GF317_20100 [Candidatus Lokiarchaeota archaeon]|nr:hypothetical protein [Candidatus Lokiarchaeota archaeon]MBD3201785.1 hypothetical protein [Candidatus Lokiarchaeota archaeon]